MLSVEEVKNIANLARVGLDESEINKSQHDLSVVLDYFKELEKLETGKVASIDHITGRENVTREDAAENLEFLERENILKNAPEVKGNQIKVKSVF